MTMMRRRSSKSVPQHCDYHQEQQRISTKFKGAEASRGITAGHRMM
jgi:hypothetical protein